MGLLGSPVRPRDRRGPPPVPPPACPGLCQPHCWGVMWWGRAEGRGWGTGRAHPCAPALEGSLPATSPELRGRGEVQDGGGACTAPRSSPQQTSRVHMGHPVGPCRSRKLRHHKSPPSGASASPVRGTDGQAAIPCPYGRHRAHDNTDSTSTAASPPCIKWEVRTGLLHHPKTPFMHPLPISSPTPGHRGHIQPLPSATWTRTLSGCSVHPQHLSAAPPQHWAPLPAPTGHSPTRGGPAAGSDWDSSKQG